MVRPLTQQLIECVAADILPGMACCVDFGLDGWADTNPQKCWEALRDPILRGEVTAEQLDEALGSGPKLTALVRSCPSNPHKDIEFRLAWDDVGLD